MPRSTTRVTGALLAALVAATVTVVATQSGSATDATAAQLSSTAAVAPALDSVLGLTRFSGGETYRDAGVYSAGSALTSLSDD